MRFIVGDTETSGLGKEKKACEIALREVDINLNPLMEWHSLIDPEIPINPAASAINGITDAMVAHEPTSEEFVTYVLGGKLDGDICLIGHNIDFDLSMLQCIGNITHTICTLDLARAYITGPVNYKLQTLREFLNIPEDNAHTAMGDVNVTHQLLRILVEISGRNIEQHAHTEQRVIHHMPFGKHAGTPIMDLPISYMDWLLSLADINKALRDSVATARLLK